MPTRVCWVTEDKAVPGMTLTISQGGRSCAPTCPYAWVLFNSLLWTQPQSVVQLWAITKWSITTWCASLEEPCGVAATAEKAWESTGALEKLHGEHAGQLGHQTRPRDKLPWPTLSIHVYAQVCRGRREGSLWSLPGNPAALLTPLSALLKRQSCLQSWGFTCSTRVHL